MMPRIPVEAWREPQTEVRIQVDHWLIDYSIGDQFIERPRSVRLIWNYLRRVGWVAVWRKIRSRLAEETRNRKVAGVGTGAIIEAPPGGALWPGDRVIFFAPNHSRAWPRVVVDARFVRSCRPDGEGVAVVPTLPEELRALVGWTPYAGIAVDSVAIQSVLARIDPGVVADRADRAGVVAETVRDRVEIPSASGRPSAVVFGFGNYAKTQIIPHVRSHLRLSAIHEVDQDQLATAVPLRVTLDSCPVARDTERYDAWFIAGYHHTHASLAIRALDDGAYAVVEKPVATTHQQLAALEIALARSEARRLFSCFHKRYSRLNDWAHADLGVESAAPVDMQCIVYEIPLPARHWYNWPSSGSRLTSNGCHWLDYFLYHNDNCAVRELDVRHLRGSDLLVWVRLDNGARLTMTLTDTGSQRLGVRDVIDLRAGDVTVRLVDSTYYEAETTTRVLRRRRLNPMRAYSIMYETICRRIAEGVEGDSIESLRSTALMLDLEDALGRQER